MMLALCGCDVGSSSYSLQPGAEYQRQVEVYDAHARRAEEQLAKSEQQASRTDRLLEITERQAKITDDHLARMEKLLQKYEGQASRQDAILDTQERVFQRLSEALERR